MNSLLMEMFLSDVNGFEILVVDARIECRIERRQEVNGFVDRDRVLDPLGTSTFVGGKLADDGGHFRS